MSDLKEDKKNVSINRHIIVGVNDRVFSFGNIFWITLKVFFAQILIVVLFVMMFFVLLLPFGILVAIFGKSRAITLDAEDTFLEPSVMENTYIMPSLSIDNDIYQSSAEEVKKKMKMN